MSLEHSPVREGALAVRPKAACVMLDVGMTRLYELLAAGELVFYKDGSSTKIIVRSIHDYIARRIAETAKVRNRTPSESGAEVA